MLSFINILLILISIYCIIPNVISEKEFQKPQCASSMPCNDVKNTCVSIDELCKPENKYIVCETMCLNLTGLNMTERKADKEHTPQCTNPNDQKLLSLSSLCEFPKFKNRCLAVCMKYKFEIITTAATTEATSNKSDLTLLWIIGLIVVIVIVVIVIVVIVIVAKFCPICKHKKNQSHEQNPVKEADEIPANLQRNTQVQFTSANGGSATANFIQDGANGTAAVSGAMDTVNNTPTAPPDTSNGDADTENNSNTSVLVEEGNQDTANNGGLSVPLLEANQPQNQQDNQVAANNGVVDDVEDSENNAGAPLLQPDPKV